MELENKHDTTIKILLGAFGGSSRLGKVCRSSSRHCCADGGGSLIDCYPHHDYNYQTLAVFLHFIGIGPKQCSSYDSAECSGSDTCL